MGFWAELLDIMIDELKVGCALLGTFAGFCMLAYIVIEFDEDILPWIKGKIRKQIRKWYRKQRRSEQKNRVKNAKAIEQWCRQDFYGDL